MTSPLARLIGIAACVVGSFLLFSGEASANLLVPQDLMVSSDWAGVLYLFTVNLPVDVFVYSLFLALACHALESRVGNVAATRRAFIASVVVGCVVIAIIGAVVDFYLLFEGGSATAYLHFYNFRLDIVNTTAACLLVFASVFLVSVLVARVSRMAGLVVGVAVAAANLVSWYSLTIGSGVAVEEAYWVSLIFLVALALPMQALVRWHSVRGVPA